MLIIGLLVLLGLALSLGWLLSGCKFTLLRTMGLVTLGISLVLFFAPH